MLVMQIMQIITQQYIVTQITCLPDPAAAVRIARFAIANFLHPRRSIPASYFPKKVEHKPWAEHGPPSPGFD